MLDDGRDVDDAPRWVFFEKQVRNNCAIAALNNAKQGPRFCQQAMGEIATTLEAATQESQHDEEGNFSAMAVQAALASVDADMVLLTKEDLLDLSEIEDGISHRYWGVLFHSVKRDHWWAAAEVSKQWFMLDSLAPGPQKVLKRIELEVLDRVSDDVSAFGITCQSPFSYQGWSVACLQEFQGWCEESVWDRFILEQVELETEQEIKDQELDSSSDWTV